MGDNFKSFLPNKSRSVDVNHRWTGSERHVSPVFHSDSLFNCGDAIITVMITFYAGLSIIHGGKSSVDLSHAGHGAAP